MNEIEQTIQYAIKEGYIDDSAGGWTEKEKEDYYNKCQLLS